MPTYEEASIAVLKEVIPLVAGEWKMARVYVHRRPFYIYPSLFPTDTILHQFATLTLASTPTSKPWDALYPTFEGTLDYKHNLSHCLLAPSYRGAGASSGRPTRPAFVRL
jgi:hypothetical protein